MDGNWRSYIPKEYPNHGSVCFVMEDEELESGTVYDKLCFIDNYIAPKYVRKAVEDGVLLEAETLEELIVKMGGIQSDEEAHCYDTEGAIIPGLYAAGNVQGNRVAVDYPLTVPGLSHSLALVYGRIAVESAVRESR